MQKDLQKIKDLLFKYINIIKEEYPDCNLKALNERLKNNEEIVEFNDANTITFFVKDAKLLLPQAAYKVFEVIKQDKNYGTNKNNCRSFDEYTDTNTTYMEYISHVIAAGLTVYDYYEESLLHEAMHICGSGGGTPLEEGINELKTRELAQKYQIKIAGYAYSKEVEVAKKMQDILGKEIMDELTFVPGNARYKFLKEKVGQEKADLYSEVSYKMYRTTQEFFREGPKTSNPVEKAKLYEKIDYSEVNKYIEEQTTKEK